MKQVGHIKDHWTCVDVPPRFMESQDYHQRTEARNWLLECESPGKFYAGAVRYYFEFPEDAAMYLLRWS